MKLKLALAGLMIVVAPTLVHAEGDAKKGEKVFKKCKACHSAKKEKNKVGPHLVGIVGRAAGSVEKYKYSKAMKAKAAEIGNWDEAKIMEYITNPKKYLGGKSKMTYKLKKEGQRADVVAYLKSLAK
jgi:cytochrome c